MADCPRETWVVLLGGAYCFWKLRALLQHPASGCESFRVANGQGGNCAVLLAGLKNEACIAHITHACSAHKVAIRRHRRGVCATEGAAPRCSRPMMDCIRIKPVNQVSGY